MPKPTDFEQALIEIRHDNGCRIQIDDRCNCSRELVCNALRLCHSRDLEAAVREARADEIHWAMDIVRDYDTNKDLMLEDLNIRLKQAEDITLEQSNQLIQNAAVRAELKEIVDMVGQSSPNAPIKVSIMDYIHGRLHALEQTDTGPQTLPESPEMGPTTGTDNGGPGTKCRNCGGTGFADKSRPGHCPVCHGTGVTKDSKDEKENDNGV